MRKRWQILFVVLNLFSVLGLVRLLADHLHDPFSLNWVRIERFEGLKKAFPEMTDHPGKKILFLGTSTWHYFLNPLHMDDQLAKRSVSSESYNISFAGAIGQTLAIYTRRLQSEFYDRHAKFGATVIELNPLSLSREFHLRNYDHLDWRLSSIFLNWRMWRESAMLNPPNAAYLVFDQLLQPIDIEVMFNEALGRTRVISRPGVASFWGRSEFLERPAWNAHYRGLSNWNLPASKKEFTEALENLHQPDEWENMLSRYSNVHGLDDRFAYDRNSVEMFMTSVRLAKKFSHHVYIVLFQATPSIQATLDRYADIDGLKRRLEKETGVQVLDYSKSFHLRDQDFADAEHPRTATIDRWLPLLADQMIRDQVFSQPRQFLPSSKSRLGPGEQHQ
jgi:hypothetical protein